ncbi:MAG: hypothetical protein WDN31_08730 [Hyphomicrobium sp.]
MNCGLTRRELDRIIEVCADIREEVGMAEWRSTKRKPAAPAKPPAPVPSRRFSLGRGGILNGWLHGRQLDGEAGADANLRFASDGASASFDNHPAE